MAKQSRKRGVSLPWEHRSAWFRELFRGSRWRQLFGLTIVIFSVIGIWQNAVYNDRVRVTRLAIDEVTRAATAFREEIGRCPNAVQELTRPPRAGRRYLRRVPHDAWGHDLFMECPSRRDPESLNILSAGPSGSLLMDDNIQ
jgi:hypothetical protein